MWSNSTQTELCRTVLLRGFLDSTYSIKPTQAVVSWYCLHPNTHMYPPNKWRSKLHRNERLEEVELQDTVTKLHIQSALEAHFIFLLTTLIFHNFFVWYFI